MEKFVCFLMCLVAFVSTASALKCYTCESDKLDGCIKSSNPKDVPCGNPAPNFVSVCTYKVFHDTAKNTDKVRAGCDQIASNLPMTKDNIPDCKQLQPGTDLKECRVCDKDLCNSSSVLGTSMVSFLCLPLMYLVTKFVLS
ncbi:hypothetical protein PPYR_13855 [Photinus pyralis]|uniref:Protein sleepless n=1 Tax=Photinus pyralis TaxID=7054 RepID=A0A5N4AA84_PHOPY|nr:uncharacterized protein LOC116178364 [Photinus pyralis]KAB0794235.1 hypothetical protein PPYR_13855 [Photinus pyralis]